MHIQQVFPKQASLPPQWARLLERTGLTPESVPEQTVLIWEGDVLAATGSRDGDILKYIAVDPSFQGTDLLAAVLTQLRQDAFDRGRTHLFLYTKPANQFYFQDLFFYPVAKTADVLLMENRKNGLQSYLDALPKRNTTGSVGAAVMNCAPFTRGHRYLIETAARDCEHLYVFVLSEEQGPFPAADRLRLVQLGTADLPNVTVVPTGPYLISSATFPTYFLPDRDRSTAVSCQLDVELFAHKIAPALGITCRYVGTEPYSPLTDAYNRLLAQQLPLQGIRLKEIPRLEVNGHAVSASAVRKALQTQEWEVLEALVPATTLAYLREKTHQEG